MIDPLGLNCEKNSSDIWWSAFFDSFMKGAHETTLGFLEGLPGWTHETSKYWYAYEGDPRHSQSYWEGRATYTFSGGIMESVIIGMAKDLML